MPQSVFDRVYTTLSVTPEFAQKADARACSCSILLKESSRPFRYWVFGQRQPLAMTSFVYRSHRLLTHFVSILKPYPMSLKNRSAGSPTKRISTAFSQSIASVAQRLAHSAEPSTGRRVQSRRRRRASLGGCQAAAC
jgi:hypothetical protein